MDDLEHLLRAKAEEMRLDPSMPSTIRRRARRRRTGNLLLTGLIVIGLGVGAFAGGRQLLGDGPPGLRPADQATTASLSLPIWPAFGGGRDVAEIDRIQEQVDQGHQPWYLSPQIVAEVFAMEVLGWDQGDIEASVRGDDPVQVSIANPSLAGSMGDVRTMLTMERWRGRSDGIYVVAGADGDILDLRSPAAGQSLTPSGQLTFEGEIRGISHRLLGLDLLARLEGGFGTLEDDGSSEPGRSFYEGSAGVGIEPGPDGGFDISVLLPDEIPPDPVLAVFVRSREGDTVTTDAFRLGESAPEPVPTPAPTPVPAGDAVQRFVADYMEARIAGMGAEQFLTQEAAAQYDADQGDPLSLYSPTSNPRYAGFEIESVEAADANSYEVLVRIIEETWPEPGKTVDTFTERLFVGPGTNVEDREQPIIIRGVELAEGGRSNSGPDGLATVDQAVAFIQGRVDLPVVLPTNLPSEIRLNPKNGVYRLRGGGWMLHLFVGRNDGLFLQYGHSTFDGCGGDLARPVDILGQRGLIEGSARWSSLIWPVAPGRLEGRYGLSGSFPEQVLIEMARTMELARSSAPEGGPTGC